MKTNTNTDCDARVCVCVTWNFHWYSAKIRHWILWRGIGKTNMILRCLCSFQREFTMKKKQHKHARINKNLIPFVCACNVVVITKVNSLFSFGKPNHSVRHMFFSNPLCRKCANSLNERVYDFQKFVTCEIKCLI